MGVEPEPREPNPYDWKGEAKRFVGRGALLERAVTTSLEGEGVFLLLGTRGMGKSMFLAHLEAELRKYAELEILSFSRPPSAAGPVIVADDILLALLNGLLECARLRGRVGPGDELEEKLRKLAKKRWLREMLEAYLDEFPDQIERIVLLYDELDEYADPSGVGRNYFNFLEDVRKKLDKRLVVVAAGGLGMLSLKSVLGSSIFTRAVRKILEPFQEEELYELAEPFRARKVDLSIEVLSTLRVLSGGNLALATYGLQELWGTGAPSPRHLTEAFDRFLDDHNDFGASIRRAIFGFDESQVPFRVWQRLKSTGGRLSKGELTSIRRREGVQGAIENKDILDMLRAGGLVRMDDAAWKADPIIAEIIPSILSFDELEGQGSLETLKEQLRADLVEAMVDIHRMTPAYYLQGNKKTQEKKKLVPEAVFAATLAAFLSARGWKTELEAMSGAGYADIKARHPRFDGEHAIIEVKLWGGDVETIHDQVKSYFAKGATALATVVIAVLKAMTWKDDYEQKCLKGKADGVSIWKDLDRPLEGYFEARWESRAVEHFLLRLPSRS